MTGALSLSPVEWLSFLTFTQNYVLEGRSGPTWSLAVEEHFYLLFPLTLMAVVRVGRRLSNPHAIPMLIFMVVAGCLTLRVLNALSGISNDDFMLSHFRVDSIVVGAGCYYLWSRYPKWVDYIMDRYYLFLIIAGVLLMQTFMFGRTSQWMFTIGFTLLSIAYGILLLIVVETQLFGFSESGLSRCLAFVGRNSYNIYLWHYFILLLPMPGYAGLQYTISRNFNGEIASLIQVLALIGYAIIVGVVATILVERPFLALRRRIC